MGDTLPALFSLFSQHMKKHVLALNSMLGLISYQPTTVLMEQTHLNKWLSAKPRSQAAQQWTRTPLPTEKLLHLCEPAKQGHDAHRSCHFEKAMTHLSQHSFCVPTHSRDAAIFRLTKMWAWHTERFSWSRKLFSPLIVSSDNII